MAQTFSPHDPTTEASKSDERTVAACQLQALLGPQLADVVVDDPPEPLPPPVTLAEGIAAIKASLATSPATAACRVCYAPSAPWDTDARRIGLCTSCWEIAASAHGITAHPDADAFPLILGEHATSGDYDPCDDLQAIADYADGMVDAAIAARRGTAADLAAHDHERDGRPSDIPAVSP